MKKKEKNTQNEITNKIYSYIRSENNNKNGSKTMRTKQQNQKQHKHIFFFQVHETCAQNVKLFIVSVQTFFLSCLILFHRIFFLFVFGLN